MMNPEDQWRAIFVRKYNRQPPDIFGSNCNESYSAVEIAGGSIEETDQSCVDGNMNLQFGNSQADFHAFTGSFDDHVNSMDFGSNDTRPLTPPLDMDAFLVPDMLEDSEDSPPCDMRQHPASKLPQANEQSHDQRNYPVLKVVSTLQEQVSSLEALISTQSAKEKDRIVELQTQNAQLEQKLFQSSERERQLEATLGVIFDAFQATGAPQAQPNRALWNLVMSHSSQAISTVTGRSQQLSEGQGASTTPSFTPMSLPMQRSSTGKRAAVHPDSAYGSLR